MPDPRWTPPPDDRLQRLTDDPTAYMAEARARARELVERDLHRDQEHRRNQRRDQRKHHARRAWCFLIHRW